MKTIIIPKFDFSSDKNLLLIEERGISFEDIIAAIHDGKLLDTIEHPDKLRYSNQRIYIVNIADYVYLVPFVEQDEESVFLKTIFPSRKLTKIYLGGQHGKKT